MSPRLELPRDLQIVYAVGTLAPATAEDIGRLLFPTSQARERSRRTTTRHRLAKLCRLGLIAALRTSNRAEPNWYALTPRGREWLVSEHGIAPGAVRVLTGVGRMNLAHHRLLSGIRVSLVVATQEHQHVELDRFLAERELRPLAEAAKLPVVPDALAVLAARDGAARVAWAIEADLGTERYAVWRKKAAGYRAVAEAGPLLGEARWGIAVVTHEPRRATAIGRVLVEEGVGAFAVVGVRGELDERTVLAPSWTVAESGRRTSLAMPLGVPHQGTALGAVSDAGDLDVSS